MANKKFWLEILVIVLVFGMTVVGCEEDHTGPSKVVITNGSTFKIKSVVFYGGWSSNPGTIIISDPSGIESGQKKTYDLGSRDWEEYYYYRVKIIVNVNLLSDVEVTGSTYGICGMETDKLLLSGTNADTLELTYTGTDYN